MRELHRLRQTTSTDVRLVRALIRLVLTGEVRLYRNKLPCSHCRTRCRVKWFITQSAVMRLAECCSQVRTHQTAKGFTSRVQTYDGGPWPAVVSAARYHTISDAVFASYTTSWPHIDQEFEALLHHNCCFCTAVRVAKLQHEAAGEISGLLAMMQPGTPSPRKHSRKGKNPRSSYNMFARPASMDAADEQGQSSQACCGLLQMMCDMHMLILACCCVAKPNRMALQHFPHTPWLVLSFLVHDCFGSAIFYCRKASQIIMMLTIC